MVPAGVAAVVGEESISSLAFNQERLIICAVAMGLAQYNYPF
jgi:hypothetical protein